jgi:hypothetical protein
MPGSSKLEREVYEQYLILKNGGTKMLINERNPMGGRMDLYYQLIKDVVFKYSLPW